jgi:hypothetical protein
MTVQHPTTGGTGTRQPVGLRDLNQGVLTECDRGPEVSGAQGEFGTAQLSGDTLTQFAKLHCSECACLGTSAATKLDARDVPESASDLMSDLSTS